MLEPGKSCNRRRGLEVKVRCPCPNPQKGEDRCSQEETSCPHLLLLSCLLSVLPCQKPPDKGAWIKQFLEASLLPHESWAQRSVRGRKQME